MPWTLDESRPIYLQLMDRIEQDIISGTYQPGDRIPSVRELAVEAAVNPNTMQKALSELERSGLLYAQRTSGRYITDDKELLQQTKEKMARKHIRQYIRSMTSIGYSAEEACDLLRKSVKDTVEKEC